MRLILRGLTVCWIKKSNNRGFQYLNYTIPRCTDKKKKNSPQNAEWFFFRAVTSTDFRNRFTVPPNSNRIRLTERFASPSGALCFHVFTGSDSPLGSSRLSLQVVSLLVSNQTSFTQIKRQSRIITCGVFMHKNKSLTWCHSPTVSSRIKAR